MRQRDVSNNSFLNTSQTEDEFISNKIRDFYLRKGSGLQDLHRRFFPDKEPLIVPKKRIRVLLLGNHSSGKSTFINWYIKKNVLSTSVAIETRKFVVVRHGKVNDIQRGMNAIKFFPEFASLSSTFGDSFVRNYLACHIVASDANKMFRMVDLIDSPGLLDEEYDGFDMNKVVDWWSHHVDVIFIFMDPYIKSTCRRTVEVIKMLFKDSKTSEKVHLFLSKSDEVTNEIERSRVLKQISEGLSKQLINRRVKILPIFIPELEQDDGEEAYIKIVRRRFFPKQEIPNCIHQACEKIQDRVQDNVGNNLSKMGSDLKTLGTKLRGIYRREEKKVERNRKVFRKKVKNYLLGVTCLVLFLVCGFFKILMVMDVEVSNIAGYLPFSESTSGYVQNLDSLFDYLEPYQHLEWVLWSVLTFFTIVFFLVGRCQGFRKTLPKESKAELEDYILSISEAEGSLDDMNRSYKEERI